MIKPKYVRVGAYCFLLNKRIINKVMCVCKDCNEDYFCVDKMVMLKDELWNSICDNTLDLICSTCIEIRMGRKIVDEDFKNIDTPCNQMYLEWKKLTDNGNKTHPNYV